MSFNLIRNSRVFFTTNVDSGTGAVLATGFSATNTFEIQVQDGFSFSQNTTSETVTLSEGGDTPVRGQRSFNTALEPADWSFSTYIRPADGGVNITAEEAVLWNAAFAAHKADGSDAIGGANAAWTAGIADATLVATKSQAHQLQKFGLIVVTDTTSFIIDSCAIDTVTIDFGLDAIASIAWAGKGATLRQVAVTATTGATPTFSGALTGTSKGKNTTAPYIANKLSTMTLIAGINGTGKVYSIAITGGSLTIANNLNYLTPANLGVVNKPATYFTGTRSITGTVNAYLRTGANSTAGLMADLLAGSDTDVDPEFSLQLEMGGKASATRVELEMPAAVLTIPSVNTEQVISTTINFTAQGYTGNAFDIGSSNELEVRYYTANNP